MALHAPSITEVEQLCDVDVLGYFDYGLVRGVAALLFLLSLGEQYVKQPAEQANPFAGRDDGDARDGHVTVPFDLGSVVDLQDQGVVPSRH